ncbi:MAG: AI-2E family transporter [Patescibacteria group bacterium]
MSKNQIIRSLALIGFVILVCLIRNVLLPIVIGILLYYVLHPLVCKLADKRPKGLGINRILAIIIAFLVSIAVFSIAIIFILPSFTAEFALLINNTPHYLSQIKGLFDSVQKWHAVANLPNSIDNIALNVMQNLLNLVSLFSQQIVNISLAILSRLIYIVIIPLITFFMLKDDEYLSKGLINLAPKEQQAFCSIVLDKIDAILKNYVIGQTILCTIVGLLTSLVLYFLGIKFYVILGLVAAVSQLIPNIGPFIGAAPTLLISLIISPLLALKVLLFYLILNVLIVAVLAPKILGDKLNLHPLTIVISVLVLGEIAGLWGLFFAPPIVAILKVLYLELQKTD